MDKPPLKFSKKIKKSRIDTFTNNNSINPNFIEDVKIEEVVIVEPPLQPPVEPPLQPPVEPPLEPPEPTVKPPVEPVVTKDVVFVMISPSKFTCCLPYLYKLDGVKMS